MSAWARTQLMATFPRISLTPAPREQSQTTFAKPCSVGMRELLHQLHADVSNVQVGPDDDVRTSRDCAFPTDLALGDAGVNGGIELELAVDR